MIVGNWSSTQPRPNLTRPTVPVVFQPRVQAVVSPPPFKLLRPQPIENGIRAANTGRVVRAGHVAGAGYAGRAAPAVAQRKGGQQFQSRVVQATKFYPNLHPGAVEPIDPGNIFRLNSFADQYRLHKVNSHGVNVPNQQYNFVRTREGEMLLHSRYRHPSIAEGKQVLYAGEIFFNNGQLQWWSNGSGHYQPDRDSAEQANLPMDYFFSYQQIIKGEHTRKKG